VSDALSVMCPYCGAAPDERCKTIKSQRTTDTHSDRWLELTWQRAHRA
jgi:hypothetical protein